MIHESFMVNLNRGVVENFFSLMEFYEWTQEEIQEIKHAALIRVSDANLLELANGYKAIDEHIFNKHFLGSCHMYVRKTDGRGCMVSITHAVVLISDNHAMFLETNQVGVTYRKSKLMTKVERIMREKVKNHNMPIITIDFKEGNREIFSNNPTVDIKFGRTRREIEFVGLIESKMEHTENKEHLLYILSEINYQEYKKTKEKELFSSFDAEDIRKTISNALKSGNFYLPKETKNCFGFEMS